ncbi:MAG: hypothetical protein WAT39_21140 [Planctomycetota bacterium]
MAAFSLPLSLRTQDWVWRIPERGAVEYQRQWQGKASEPQRSPALARAAPAAAKVPDRYLNRLPPAPWLCQGELRPDQKALTGPIRDLRDALRAVACDLANRSSARLRCPRLLPFGDVVLSGSWSPAAADGTQTLRGTVTASAPAAIAGEGREVLDRLKPFCIADANGTVTMTRRIDAARGVVVDWHGELDLVVDEGDKLFRRVVVEDRWHLVAVRDNQDADFRKRVAAAIRAGTEWVRDAIEDKKSFLAAKGGDERDYGGGRLALGLLALLHGGVGTDDAVVQRGFQDLCKRRLEDSYSLAAALMAIAALHTPPGEAARVRDGGLTGPVVHQLPERDAKVAAKWLAQLLANVDPRGPAANVLRFNYSAGPRYDTSLQQYGLLGLWSAQGCGLEVPAGAFAAAARHLLAVQGRGQGSLSLRLVSYAQLRDAAGTEAGPAASERRASVRGWAYQDADEPAFGSMTSAGVGGLLLARAGMAARGENDRAVGNAIDDAVCSGQAWLAEQFSVRCNPGFAERADHHWYYWLYCLERSCELAGVAWLHGRDWYYEGGLQLIAQQRPSGAFPPEHSATLQLDATAFAILFLAKSTAPAPITGR